MREADAVEVHASSGLTPLEAVLDSLRRSTYARAAVIGDEVVAMWGVAPVERQDIGVVWLLGTRRLNRYPVAFVSEARRELRQMLQVRPVLANWVDARYQSAVRWAGRVGFRVCDPEPFGHEGRPFHPIFFWEDRCVT
jgi:hypothetical protein